MGSPYFILLYTRKTPFIINGIIEITRKSVLQVVCYFLVLCTIFVILHGVLILFFISCLSLGICRVNSHSFQFVFYVKIFSNNWFSFNYCYIIPEMLYAFSFCILSFLYFSRIHLFTVIYYFKTLSTVNTYNKISSTFIQYLHTTLQILLVILFLLF